MGRMRVRAKCTRAISPFDSGAEGARPLENRGGRGKRGGATAPGRGRAGDEERGALTGWAASGWEWLVLAELRNTSHRGTSVNPGIKISLK